MSPAPSIATIFSFSNTNLLAIRVARACAASSHQATVQVLAVSSLADVLSREPGTQFRLAAVACCAIVRPCFGLIVYDRNFLRSSRQESCCCGPPGRNVQSRHSQ